jgi:hypothetical protein
MEAAKELFENVRGAFIVTTTRGRKRIESALRELHGHLSRLGPIDRRMSYHLLFQVSSPEESKSRNHNSNSKLRKVYFSRPSARRRVARAQGCEQNGRRRASHGGRFRIRAQPRHGTA